MRSRRLIEKDQTKRETRTSECYETVDNTVANLQLEVLLDIRDLLERHVPSQPHKD